MVIIPIPTLVKRGLCPINIDHVAWRWCSQETSLEPLQSCCYNIDQMI
jgi:hypothetical protein